MRNSQVPCRRSGARDAGDCARPRRGRVQQKGARAGACAQEPISVQFSDRLSSSNGNSRGATAGSDRLDSHRLDTALRNREVASPLKNSLANQGGATMADAQNEELSALLPPVTTPTELKKHAREHRGEHALPPSSFETGRFGPIFRKLPVFEQQPQDLRKLAQKMISAGGPAEDPDIPAGSHRSSPWGRTAGSRWWLRPRRVRDQSLLGCVGNRRSGPDDRMLRDGEHPGLGLGGLPARGGFAASVAGRCASSSGNCAH